MPLDIAGAAGWIELALATHTLTCSRRFGIVAWSMMRECLTLMADTSLSARDLRRLIGRRDKPHAMVSDNGIKLNRTRRKKEGRFDNYMAARIIFAKRQYRICQGNFDLLL